MGLIRDIFPKHVKSETVDFLFSCLHQIHDRSISMALPQLRAGLLRYERLVGVREPNYIAFTYAPEVSARFEDPLGRSLRVTNIKIKNEDGSAETHANIYFSRGLICGYAFSKNLDFRADLGTVDTSKARIEFLDTLPSELESLLSPSEAKLINWSDVFEVEIEGITYYHLKDIGDGDFIGIDKTGHFFEVLHDPPITKRLSGNLSMILAKYS